MKDKYIAGYCWKCGRTTKQEVIRCTESVAERLFLGIMTLGMNEMFGHSYQCECTECGSILITKA